MEIVLKIIIISSIKKNPLAKRGFFHSLHQVDDETIERFTQELLKEYPGLSEEETREFIISLGDVIKKIFLEVYILFLTKALDRIIDNLLTLLY